MISACVVFLIILQNANAVSGPSFRSNFNEGGKPILRMSVQQEANESDKSNWIEKLQSDIIKLVHGYGYEDAKPHIEKLVEETEAAENVVLHVEGTSSVGYKRLMRSSRPSPTRPPPPQWLIDFKSFIKNLIERYGRHNVDEHLTPVIKYVERLNKVYIKDVDVDEYGEIYVSYVDKGTYKRPIA